MLAKILGLLLSFVLAVSAAIPEATYFIYSGKSDTSIRSYTVGESCYVSSTTENPGLYQMVFLTPKFCALSHIHARMCIHSGK
jgi:hypothetical protein